MVDSIPPKLVAWLISSTRSHTFDARSPVPVGVEAHHRPISVHEFLGVVVKVPWLSNPGYRTRII